MGTTKTNEKSGDASPGPGPAAEVATFEQNAALEHSEGGTTTRRDLNDAGVPMLPGDASEPVGPEDALGQGLKRGDYRDRVVGNPHESVALPDGGEPVYADDADGNPVIVDRKPISALVPQAPRAQDIGDAAGQKGGVTTAPTEADRATLERAAGETS